MANKWAIQNGNWSDGSTWNDGVVPTADDDVWLNGKTVNVDCNLVNTINVNELHNDLCEQTNLSGGFLNITNNSNTNTLTLNCNIYGVREQAIFPFLFININGNCNSCYISYSAQNKTMNIIGNCKDVYFEAVSGKGGTRNLNVTGTITISENKPFLSPKQYTGAVFNLNLQGILDMYDLYTSGTNVQSISILGLLKVNKPTITINATVNLNGTLDVTKINGKIPIAAGKTFTIGNQAESYVALVVEPDIPQSVVLEGYQYGDKVGTLKTVPDNVAIVNLTEQQLQRVGNCATVSTVQKCFEEFKE